MTLSEDTILEDRYRIDGLITQNRTGATYRGFDVQLNTPVVIKEKNLQAKHTAAVNQFKQEALILTGLRHPGIPWVIRHFSFAGQQYLVMDFVTGESLWEFMQKSGRPYPERYALQYISQICQPLTYLHQQNPPVFHRDIKPHNIRFSPTGKAILVDFGIAKASETTDPLSIFIAPEQLQGQLPSPASDIYALGATLYTLITGQMPSTHPTATKEFDPTAASNSTLTPQTAQLIAQAMRFNPAERAQSVTDWQKEVENALDSTTSSPLAKNISIPNPDSASTKSVSQSSPAGDSLPNFWLVDSTGLGYPITSETLIIGSHPEANIHIEDLGVAPFHAHLRQEGQRCLIMDENSEHGTLLNNHRLRSGWYPFEPGDTLIIGPTRFHLTTTKPVKLGSTQLHSKPIPLPVVKPEPELQAQPNIIADTPLLFPKKRAIFLPVLGLIGLLLLGGVFYFLFNPTSTSSNISLTPSSQSQEIITSPGEGEVEGVSQVVTSTRTTALSEAEEAALLQDAPTLQVTIVTPAQTVTPVTATPVQERLMLTESTTPPITPTLTPTRLPAQVTPATPTPAGPTVIAVNFEETIDEIGAREVIDVDLNPKNPREVYALVKRDGLYKSNDGGDGPWLKLPVDGLGVVAFVIDPTNPAQFYAPTWNAVLKSSDGGNIWTANTNGLSGNKIVDTVTVNPVNPNILYAGIGENMVVSTNGGQTWTSSGYGEGLGVSKIYSLVVDPFAPKTLYVAGLAGSIYKSEDGGVTFSQLPDNIGQGAFSMVAHPSQRNVYLAGINSATAAIIKTEDGFRFSPVSSGLVYGGADSPYNTIVYAPSNPNIVYAGSGDEENQLAKGIFKSTNGGAEWQQISDDLPRNPDTRQSYYVKSLAVHPTNPNIVFAATGGGLYQSVDGGSSWLLR
jgi:serine/threonine-protein kinase